MAFPTDKTVAVDGVTEIIAAHLNHLEDKVGINNSADPNSLDYQVFYHNHQAPVGVKVDHGLGITGLIDDDHTQYALLAGRAGGQTLNFGLNAGDDGYLSSNPTATKGKIYFGANSVYNEVNDRLGIGTVSPTDQVSMVNATGTAGFSIDSGSGATYKYDWIAFKHGGLNRWSIYKTNDSSGDLAIGRYNDAGNYVGQALFLNRLNGNFNIEGGLFVPNGKNFYVGTDAGAAPNTGYDSSLGQWFLNRKGFGASNSIVFRSVNVKKWEIGLDSASNDFVLAFSQALSEDLLRIKETGVAWFGTSVKLGICKIPTTYALEIDGDVSLDPGHVYRVNAVQVVGARVIDANCDDAINAAAWDATTAGVLTALRDAMVSHGLVAAS